METSRVISKEQPVKLSDGFRHERCANCGRVIGYGAFWSRRIDWAEVPWSDEMVSVWDLHHEEGGCVD